MNYVEVSRTVEHHSECILFVYLQDGNGIPVGNTKMKIWGGPLPDGLPPYFVDDDPNNPNRRTDANGKFQFIVANPAPANRLDFFVQVLGAGDDPVSQPIHFPFPANQAEWVIVTLAPEGATPGGDGETPPVPDLQLDPRLASEVGVSVQFAQPASSEPYWKLISAQFQNPDESGGNVNIVCFVQDERGHPLPGATVAQKFPGDQATDSTDERGHVDFPMTGNSSFAPDRGEHGPYSALVVGLPSDTVVGMGLPLRRHVQYVLTWRKVVTGATPAPTPEPQKNHSAVSGRILNAPAGAQVNLMQGVNTLTAPVEADGAFSFSDLAAGSYSLALTNVGVIHSDIVLDGSNTMTFDYVVPVAPTPTLAPTQKSLTHYLLFGPGTQPGTLTNLILALDYILRFAPTVGFKIEDAQTAEHVTIVGDHSAVGEADERRLREAGCAVARLSAADSYALESVFQQLLASGSPYPA